MKAVKRPVWEATLPDARAITRYIERFAPCDVDSGLVEEYYRGQCANLRELPLSKITLGDRDHNRRMPALEARYARKPVETMPPIVVQNGEIEDGSHRFRVAKKLKLKTILCYVVSDAPPRATPGPS